VSRVISFRSAKASPGVTTLVQALALAWPIGRLVLVVEADSAGGDLATRLDLPAESGLVSLAAAGRRNLSATVVAEHVQQLDERVALLAGPTPGAQARAALGLVGDRLAGVLGEIDDCDVLVDGGRVDGGTPSPFDKAAEMVVLVARPTAAEVVHVAPVADELRESGCPIGLVLVGEAGPTARHLYPAAEVAGAIGVPVIGTIADDQRSAAVLTGHRRGERILRRSPLCRSAADLAASLTHAVIPTGEAAGTTGGTILSAIPREEFVTTAVSSNGGRP